jgi:hypothetical protein
MKTIKNSALSAAPKQRQRKIQMIHKVFHLARNIEGDYAEIGVYSGATFQHIVAAAHRYGKKAHAFDSFQGMAAPGPTDGANYPKGRFSIGGVDGFHAAMSDLGLSQSQYVVHAGFVPACFPKALPLACAYVDLDHHQPQLAALRWAWSQLSPGGILLADDAVEDWSDGASGACHAFRNEIGMPGEFYVDQWMTRKCSNMKEGIAHAQ